jgi:hypothetical protein
MSRQTPCAEKSACFEIAMANVEPLLRDQRLTPVSSLHDSEEESAGEVVFNLVYDNLNRQPAA